MLFRRILRILRNLFLIFIVFSIVWVVSARFIPIYVTPLMAIRSVEAMVRGEMPKNSKTWVPIEEISPNMVRAVVASEDNLFLKHHGFSFNDIGKASVDRRLSGVVRHSVFRYVAAKSKALALHIKNGIWKARAFLPSMDSLSDYWRRQVITLT